MGIPYCDLQGDEIDECVLHRTAARAPWYEPTDRILAEPLIEEMVKSSTRRSWKHSRCRPNTASTERAQERFQLATELT